jgi:RNA polymerase sigma-70 factor (ECF subfamily)
MGTVRDSASDSELLRGSAHDPAAFELLYERHAPSMRRWLVSRVTSDAVANELLAETFAQAWRARKRFSGVEPHDGAAWLYGIARNLLRQHYKHGRVETAARRRLGMSVPTGDHDGTEEIVTRLDAQALAPQLERALDTLPVAQQRALDARVVRELEYTEVAAELACSQENARAHVSRGLRKLNTIFKGAQT